LSIRGNGTSTYGYYFRQVVATVQLWNPLTSTWIDSGSKTLAIGGTTSTVKSDSIACTGVTGKTKVRVLFTSSDAGGGFTIPPTSNAYNYSSSTVYGSGTTTSNGAHAEYALTYSPPAGWEVYSVTYAFKFRASAGGSAGFGYSQVYAPHGGTYAGNFYSGVTLINGTRSTTCGDWGQIARTGGYCTSNPLWWNCSYSLSYMENIPLDGVVALYSCVFMEVKDGSATVYIRQLIANSSTPSNTNTLVSYSWETEDNVAISTGSLNWQAVGD